MTPVVLLSDAFIGNGSSAFRLPEEGEYPEIKPRFVPEGKSDWHPYDRDENTKARYWAIPGTPGLTHRLGGLEKDSKTGAISTDPETTRNGTPATGESRPRGFRHPRRRALRRC